MIGGTNTIWDILSKTIKYYEQIKLGQQHSDGACESNGNYAVFLGGRTSSIVETIDSNLIINSASTLSSLTFFPAIAKLNYNIILAGGQNNSYVLGNAYAFNSEMVKTDLSKLTTNRRQLMGANTKNYVIFAGGETTATSSYIGKDTVDVYDLELVKGTATSLSTARCLGASGNIGEYSVFAGGYNRTTSSNVVDIYDNNLSRTSSTLITPKCWLAGVETSKYLLLAGGGSNAKSTITYNDIEVFDKNLIKTTPIKLSVARSKIGAMNFRDNIFFAGGYDGTSELNTLDVFDSDLVRNDDMLTIPSANNAVLATPNKKYGFLLMGWSSTVYVYK